MAAEDQIVRITYQQLEEIVVSAELDKTSGNSRYEIPSSQSSRTQNRPRQQRRPALQIYRPGQLRHGQEDKRTGADDREENWYAGSADDLKLNSTDEDGSRGSKESSGDVFSHDVQKRLDDLHIGSPQTSGKDREQKHHHPGEKNYDLKRHSKRPEIQRYIPKGRAFDKERSEEKESMSSVLDEMNPDNASNLVTMEAIDPGGGTSPRKVQVKSYDRGMKVTVLNESMTSPSGKSPSGKSPSGRSPSGRSPLLQRKEFSSRHDSEHNSIPGGEWWGKIGPPGAQRRGKSMREAVRDSSTWKEERRLSNKEERNAAFKSYSKNRRSNSSDSRQKKNPDDNADKKEPYTFSSDTFPRTKSGGNKTQQANPARDLNGATNINKGAGRDGDKLYIGVTRQRTGSISSEASCASYNSNGSTYSGSSDWYTEEDEPEHVLNWAEEVEKAHLEEVARLVNHGAQELTSSLNHVDGSSTQEAVPAPNIPQKVPYPEKMPTTFREKGVKVRSKRRTRSRKSSSQYGSRDSSVHSSIQGEEDCFSERGGARRRRRRRHNSGRSQSGQLEGRFAEDQEEFHGGDENRSRLQVTFGHNNRHVEVNREGRSKPKPIRRQGSQDGQNQEPGSWGDGRSKLDTDDVRKDRQHPRREKDLPPRFRRESGGGDDSQARKGKGRGGRAINHDPEPESDRAFLPREPRGISDSRLTNPAHDATSTSRISQRGRGRGHHNSHGGGRQVESRRDLNSDHTQRRDRKPQAEEANSGKQQQQHGLIHLPPKADISQSQLHSSSQPHPANTAFIPTSTHHPQSRSSVNQVPQTTATSRGPIQGQKQLFDPSNPSMPIMMQEAKPQIPHRPDREQLSPVCTVGSPSSSPIDSSSLTMSYPPSFYPHHHPMYGFRTPMPPFPPGPYPMGPFPQGGVPSHMYCRFPRMASSDMAHYFGSDLEGEGSRAQSHMMAEQIFRDSSPFECQLGNILSRRHLSEDSQRMMNQIRFELQNRLEQVILLNIEVANRHNVEQCLWKSVYYQIIEAHRKRMSEDPQDMSSKEKLLEVLNEGNRFFENLLQRLQSTHGFDLDVFTEGSRLESEGVNRYVKLALLSAQRIMMFLGDIARYKEQLSETTNYGRARQWYLKAQKLHPRNGRPYNQLAILAVYTKRKLDAVYYYMRSLAASNPILTARESLMSLFDEVRRKVEVTEKKRLEERRQRLARHKKRKTLGARLEIWVSPDGTQIQDTMDENEEDDLSSLSPVELNKRFTLTFLNVHGKLFTKINFESFAESSSLMLQEFATLLQHSPSVISSTRLLQLMGVNMFAIDNTALKDESLEASCRSVLQEHAVQVGLEMFGLLAGRAADLLTSHLEMKKEGDSGRSTRRRDLDEDVHQMLPALKAWVDWMMCHAQLWNPQPFNRPPELGPDVDVWQSLAQLCDLLNDLDTGHLGLTREKLPGTEPVILQEDNMLAGFIPMLSAPQELFYTDTSADMHQSEDWLRIEKLRLFGEYLCGVEPPMLTFDVDTGKYNSITPKPEDEMEQEKRGQNLGEESEDECDDVVIEPGSDNEQNDGGDEQKDRIQKLKLKKAQLNKQREEREKNKENMEAILASHRHAKIELEIHPIFLIPDTNCFIDHFTALKVILHSRKYTLVVPLVVINELDGLARGAREDQYHSPEHANMVQSQAKAAVGFLEGEFEGKHPNLRAQTSKGSILETIAFRSEEANNAGINDDIILSCCLHYCKDKAREFMPRSKDCPVRLHREVVLLTEDRNLRLKAHTCNVPVRDVVSFKKWSKIS